MSMELKISEWLADTTRTLADLAGSVNGRIQE